MAKPTKDSEHESAAAKEVEFPSAGTDFERQSLSPLNRQSQLPVVQIAILCLVRLTEPVAFSQIFPYINTMILDFHIVDQPGSSGFYSGTIDSAFAVAQVCALYHFGRLSDKFGRRPALIVGLLGTVLSTLTFGLSTSFPWLLISRALSGVFCGSSPVILSSVSELVDEELQARVSPMMGSIWPVGVILGSSLGGLLFGTTTRGKDRAPEILQRRPHFVPCFATATIAAASAAIVACYFKETLSRDKTRSNVHTYSGYGSTANTITTARNSETSNSPPLLQEEHKRKTGAFRKMIISNFLLSLIQGNFEVVFPLWAYTPVELGGLGMQPGDIGRLSSLTGIFVVLLTLSVFPILRSRFGKLAIYRTTMWIWPTLFICMPLLSYTSGGIRTSSDRAAAAMWTGLVGMACLRGLGEMAFAANGLIVRAAAAKQGSLGRTFSIAQIARSVARAAAPTFASYATLTLPSHFLHSLYVGRFLRSIFSISAKHQLLRGNFVWVVLLAIALCGAAYEPVDN